MKNKIGYVGRLHDPIKLPKIKISFWEKINGKKRNFGFVIQGLGYLASLFHPAGKGLTILGGLLSGVGVAHDIGKKSKYGEPGSFSWQDFLNFISDLIQKIWRRS